jgi:hypothetical protein
MTAQNASVKPVKANALDTIMSPPSREGDRYRPDCNTRDLAVSQPGLCLKEPGSFHSWKHDRLFNSGEDGHLFNSSFD